MMPADKLVPPILAMPRVAKRFLALSVDIGLCLLTVWFAYCLRLDDWIVIQEVEWLPAVVSPIIAIPIFIRLGLYRAIFRYAGLSAFVTVLKAVAIYGLFFMIIFTAISVPGVPRTLGILQPLLLVIAVTLSRLLTRYWLGNAYLRLLSQEKRTKVLIYGAGASGRQLAGALASSAELTIAGYLDDDQSLRGSIMGGLPIYDPARLPALVRDKDIKEVLLALPNTARQRRAEILESMRTARVGVRTMPDLTALAQGRVNVTDLRELDIEDLLGRDIVPPDQQLLDRNIRGKVVMVTGAGGSIGSELCLQILKNGPTCMLLVDQNEFGLYLILGELERMASLTAKPVRLIPLLASVRDGERLNQFMAIWKPASVYHAAAYKHVPLVEYNPAEGVRNNVMGTLVAAKAARDNGVENFVLISTDKAVRPTNVMGASKRLAEMVLQAMDAERRPEASGGTRFSMVRFGNVLGSSGSVVPLFRKQIRDGGPITLTHADITRYFMTIPEASQLVIQAGAMATGGDVFLLDMGRPVRIADLARRMVELSGLSVRDEDNPDGDIEMHITGLRPGEKLYEELLIGDSPQATPHPRIMRAREDFLSWPELRQRLTALDEALEANDIPLAQAMLKKLVHGYAPSSGIADLVFKERETEADTAA